MFGNGCNGFGFKVVKVLFGENEILGVKIDDIAIGVWVVSEDGRVVFGLDFEC